MKKEDYIIAPTYQGGYSSMDPDKNDFFTGYHMPARDIGMSTDARTANVLKEISESISSGEQTVELTQVDAGTFESIPKQHLKELNQLSKLTGVDISLHAPVIEPSGIGDRGFGESNRVVAERQMMQAVERAHEINPDGNIPVVFHSSAGLPGEYAEPGKEIEETMVINPDTGSASKIPIIKRNFPGEGEPNITKELEHANKEDWLNKIRNVSYYADWGAKKVQESGWAAKVDLKGVKDEDMDTQDKMMKSEFHRGNALLDSSYNELKELFEKAYKYGSPEDQHQLNDFAKKIGEKAEKIKETPDTQEGVGIKIQIINDGIELFSKLNPQIIKPLNEFAKERTIETFANIALKGYKKFKDTAPIIAIENPPAGVLFSRGGELKEIVEGSRERFVKNAKEQGMGDSEARKQAEKLIGATLDIGHMNMLRKYGYESKDIIKEAKKIAPLVKHVHLSDNFGFEHTELPMGMGNVPVKEIMQNLEKEGFKGKKIVEALQWWQHFSPGTKANNPLKPTLEAFGSPVYAMTASPGWNQSAGFQQDYASGVGNIFPDINFETWGAGFSQLPAELGGQRGGGQGSRMSGRPME